MQLPIYLDYAATTPVDPRVADKMMACLTQAGDFGNPSSHTHLYGKQAKEKVEHARSQIAAVMNVDPKTIIWTSGATESINLAIKGIAHQYKMRGKHIITSQIEHSAVLDSCRQLEREGFEVTYVGCNAQGVVSVDEILQAIRSDTLLISIAHVNNETGVIQDITAIGYAARARDIFFHVDAAQSIGKLPLNLQELPVDLLSFCAHKIYGPKGVGALYIRNKPPVRLVAQMHGGAQELRMRAGTLPTHQIVGMGEAIHIAQQEMQKEMARMKALSDRFWKGIQAVGEVSLNGDFAARVPHILNINFHGKEAAALIQALHDIAVSRGSACHSSTLEPSYVLRAMGLSEKIAQSSLRFSLGRYTNEEEIDYTIASINKVFTL